MSREMEEFKARLDCLLSDKKFIHRTLEKVAQTLEEEPASVLRFCRTHHGYNISMVRNEVYIALTDRVNEEAEILENQIREKMESGEEGEGNSGGTARLDPIRGSSKKKVNWDAIIGNLAHIHLTLERTARMVPRCSQKVLLKQAVMDIEKIYMEFSENSRNKIK